ncbi:hypothetical protein [Moorena producens]|uniref:hypothetical protein n=1 Tax=Moorena producens TaxID=1155739 RepID=UPI0011EA6EC8|nr:hypothetical protein [Moorena producens]
MLERGCWWHGYLAVERASRWNGDVGGTGMLVARACWWHGDVGGTGILPVINIFERSKPFGGALRGYWLRRLNMMTRRAPNAPYAPYALKIFRFIYP